MTTIFAIQIEIGIYPYKYFINYKKRDFSLIGKTCDF